jgi:1-deoxy-D-xylulose-5-phosphate synthase
MKLLKQIHSPQDLKKLPPELLPELAREIRELIFEVVMENGGHLGSGLGVVELTIALHYEFDFLRDRLLWDVGHQVYPHKILTGRWEQFHTLRREGGLSGFTAPWESPYDLFHTAHAGTAISTGLGLAAGHGLGQDPRKVVAVVGDAGLAVGMSFEAMNHAGEPRGAGKGADDGSPLGKELLVVLNDNKMSISRTVGAVSRYLNRFRATPAYQEFKREVHEVLNRIPVVGHGMDGLAGHLKKAVTVGLLPGQLFEAFGFEYFGPIDGHDIALLGKTFRDIRQISGPVLLHVLTQKGRGLDPAEGDPAWRHAAKPRQRKVRSDGKVVRTENRPSWTAAFAEALIRVAEKDPRVVGITAAMPDGTGIDKFQQRFPDRTFDVGICEQHGVGFAAGLAHAGLRPVVAIYSSFLQRAYDQLFHEVALQGTPLVFAMDRAGLVGSDGATHNGVFDIAYLRALVGTVLMAPKDAVELEAMLDFALKHDGPVAIRYPRDTVPEPFASQEPIALGKAEILRAGKRGVLFAYGAMVVPAMEAAHRLAEAGIELTVVNARFAKPVDRGLLEKLIGSHPFLLTIEDHVLQGGFGSAVLEAASEEGADTRKITRLGIPDTFVHHAERPSQLAQCGLHVEGIVGKVCELLGVELPRSDQKREAPLSALRLGSS